MTYRTPPPKDYSANYVPAHGPMNAEVYLVGEAPGKEENNYRRPFVGDSGQELDKLYLPRAGLSRSQVRVHNCWQYRPPDNRDPLPMEIFMGLRDLMEDIAQVNPRVIVAMGRFAIASFMGCTADDVDMELEHGVPFSWNGRTVVPTYHPAIGLHMPRMMNFLLWDWDRVGEVVRGEYRPRTQSTLKDYKLSDYFLARNGQICAIDTETADGLPWSIQSSFVHGYADMYLVDNKDTLPVWLNGMVDTVVYHNAPFDHDILEQCNIHPRKWTDTMQMAYLLGNEHQGLKTLAYKHLGIRMRTYTETVRPSAIRRARAYLEQIANMRVTMVRTFRTKKEWNEYKKSNEVKTLNEEFERLDSKDWVVTWETPTIPDPEPVWKAQGKQMKLTQPTNIVKRVQRLLDDMDKDDSIDPVARWSTMENTEQATAMFGPMPEGSLADIPLQDAVEYACKDADMTLRLYHVMQPRITAAGLQDALDTDMGVVPYILDMQRYGMKVDAEALRAFGLELDERMKQLDFRIQQEVYNKGIIKDGETFNPNSPQQVADALAAYGQSPKSTEQKYLEPLVGKVPWLRDHMEYKKLGKLRSTYVNNIIESLSDSGRLYTHFNMSRTDTGRLSSSKPVNLQNIPVRSEDGHRIRNAFVPEHGSIYAAIDYSQIEMRVAAHMSQDEFMLRMFREGLDIHGETSDRIFGNREKANRYAAKRVGFGVMYGISGIGLKELFESEGVFSWDEVQCDDMIRQWFKVYSGVASMMKGFERDAVQKGYLTGMFGRRYYVPEAMSSIPRIASGGIRKAGNAPIQGGAQGIIKRAMAKLVPVYRGINGNAPVIKPVNQCHDELMFEVKAEYLESWISIAAPVMENAVKLSVPIKVDTEVGMSWGNMDEIHEGETAWDVIKRLEDDNETT